MKTPNTPIIPYHMNHYPPANRLAWRRYELVMFLIITGLFFGWLCSALRLSSVREHERELTIENRRLWLENQTLKGRTFHP